MFSEDLIGKLSCNTWNPKNATGYHIGAKCCHDVASWLFFALSAVGRAIAEYGMMPLPTTCCHKLPVSRKAIVR